MSKLVASSIFEAHQRTCLLSIEQIQEQQTMGIDESRIMEYKNMVGPCLDGLGLMLCFAVDGGPLEPLRKQINKCDSANH